MNKLRCNCRFTAILAMALSKATTAYSSSALPREHVADIADRGIHLADVLAVVMTRQTAVHRLTRLDHVDEVLPERRAVLRPVIPDELFLARGDGGRQAIRDRQVAF